MVLGELGWQNVRDLSREVVVVIPTGALEQHGPHLPLLTDTILVSAVMLEVDKRLSTKIVVTPTLWLGASGHHLAFPGTLSASFEGYIAAIHDVVESLALHGFHKFYVLNGHGGNTDPNGVALRELKQQHPTFTFGTSSYYSFAATKIAEALEGPLKGIRHACEAETSLMLHVRPDLVQVERIRNDGLVADPAVAGVIHNFDEVTEEGSFGYATLATAEKGKAIFASAVDGVSKELETIADGYALIGQESPG
jgi:creatinine amidohydrolase